MAGLLFSYGSNHPEQLARRLGRPIQTYPALADGWARVFRGMSRTWGGGVASLERKAGAVTYGLVVPVDEEDLRILDRYEGVPRSYRRKTVDVEAMGQPERAVAYIATSREFNPPTREYLEAVARTISTHWTGHDGSRVVPEDITIRNPSRPLSVRETVSPLEYDRAAHVLRLELIDPSLPPPKKGDAYFAETQQFVMRGPTGRRYKKPRTKAIPGTPNDVAAFLDWHPYGGPDAAYIDYMKVRQDLRGQGYAQRLVESFYEDVVLPRGIGYVHWGKVMHPTVWSLKEMAETRYPDVHTSGHRDF